jgi:hypothetical protein
MKGLWALSFGLPIEEKENKKQCERVVNIVVFCLCVSLVSKVALHLILINLASRAIEA